MVDTISDQAWNEYVRGIGLRLQIARQKSGLSQEKIAHAAGISTFTYRKLEQGVSNPETPANPRLRTLAALSEVLEIPLSELVGDKSPNVALGRILR